jgi:hypothetical protein
MVFGHRAERRQGQVQALAGEGLRGLHPARMKATNCPEGDAYLKREYREGWSL